MKKKKMKRYTKNKKIEKNWQDIPRTKKGKNEKIYKKKLIIYLGTKQKRKKKKIKKGTKKFISARYI